MGAMDIRYQHPQVDTLWSLPWTYDAWWRIERCVALAQLEHATIDKDEAMSLVRSDRQPNFNDPWVLLGVQTQERKTRHDVAAFVQFMREWWGEPAGRWVHYGLTSSDVVDTAQGLRFRALYPTVENYAANLMGQIGVWQQNDTPMLGRTHGQPAEPTMMRVRADHWCVLAGQAAGTLIRDSRKLARAKLSGPVGTYAHNSPEIEARVARELKLSVADGSSQIAPRGALGRWANSAAEMVQACAKIAMDVRLLCMTREMAEPLQPGQIGSSCMAHKNNPIRAEQITGLARLAAGYASMLQPLDLWLERDISHSCVERVAVPDLWHTVLHAMDQTAKLLGNLELRPKVAELRLEEESNSAWTMAMTLDLVREGETVEVARELALAHDVESYDHLGDIQKRFLSNYPDRTGMFVQDKP